MQSELAPLPWRSRAASAPSAARVPRRGPTAGAQRAALAAGDVITMGALTTLSGWAWRSALLWTGLLVLMFAAAGLHRPRLRYSALDHLPRALAGLGLVVTVAEVLPGPAPVTPPAFARWPLAWPVAALACLLGQRVLIYRCLYRWRARSAGLPTLVLGSGEVGVRLAEALRAERGLGLVPVGLVGPVPVVHRDLPAPVLGGFDELDGVLDRYRPGAVVVAFTGRADADLVGTLRRCRRDGIAVYLVPRLFELPLGCLDADLLHGIPLVRLRPDPANRWRGGLKRAMDIAGAALALVVLSPVLAACALAVRLESGRAGVVFRQQRVGLSGKPFTILKFRSLTPSSTVESDVRWTIAHDTRVGPVGRILRATSLDELPQLLNVLRGDMSLVGPRPERPYFVEQFARTHSGYADRHRVPAGITGWAQIHGLRGDTSIEDRVRFDNYYVENWSLGLDLKIMARTVASMLSIRRR